MAPGATGCDQYRRLGLLAEERGAGADRHRDQCADCGALAAEIDGIKRLLAGAPAADQGPEWQRAVWRRIEASRPRGLRGWMVVPAVALAALVLVFWLRREPPLLTPEGPLLAMRFEAGADRPRVRGGEATVGSEAVFELRVGRAASAELRVYRDDAGLLLRCSDRPPCRREGTKLTARWRVPAVGSYRVLGISGDAAVEAPSGVYDSDLARLMGADPGLRHAIQTFEVW
jgi:hypothetical protein